MFAWHAAAGAVPPFWRYKAGRQPVGGATKPLIRRFLLRFLLCLYLVSLLTPLCLIIARAWHWARIALVAAPAILSCIILLAKGTAAHDEPDLVGFDNLALAAVLPLLGLGLMALFVKSWRWLFWLVFALNVLAGAALFYVGPTLS